MPGIWYNMNCEKEAKVSCVEKTFIVQKGKWLKPLHEEKKSCFASISFFQIFNTQIRKNDFEGSVHNIAFHDTKI